jgi:protoheme IX farnesyltransferase
MTELPLDHRPLVLARGARVRDLLELGKPRITLLVVLTTAVGLWLAPVALHPLRGALFLVGTALLVAAANTLNCWYERDVDARMHRTRNRPLPARRVEPAAALAYGLGLGAAALGLLAATTNVLTIALGALALASYVLVYTPMKRFSPWAVVVGAVPGALPPLMGWTAATGAFGGPGWLLFGILFFWQLPHFVAISLYLEDDYRRGGLRVLSVAYGETAARRHLFAYTVALVAVSFAALPIGLGGTLYLTCAAVLGTGFLAIAAAGLGSAAGAGWARAVFAYSLVYLPALIGVLVFDAVSAT